MEDLVFPNQAFWKGKKVLITGHTGFKGSWLCYWLKSLDCNILGVSSANYPQTFIAQVPKDLVSTSLNLDINSSKLYEVVKEFQPEIVFHLAAQSLVSTGHLNSLDTFKTNVSGGISILEILDEVESIKVCIFVTTDKVYKSKGIMPFLETSELGGSDPYSVSKAAIEMIIESCKFRAGLKIATVRSGNVIGGGDISTSRLIPDIVSAWKNESKLYLRNGNGIRPWMHVLDPLRGYILMAEHLHQNSTAKIAMNFGPSLDNHVKVAEIAKHACELLNIEFENGNPRDNHLETEILQINASQAEHILGWLPIWGWQKSTDMAIRWYQDYYNGKSIDNLLSRDLNEYLKS
jgi:CDP-glucose 4,6-dehydratase